MLIEQLVYAGAQTFAAAIDTASTDDGSVGLRALWNELDETLVAAEMLPEATVKCPTDDLDVVLQLRGWATLDPLDVRLFALVAAYSLDGTIKDAVHKYTQSGLSVAFVVQALSLTTPPPFDWTDVSRRCTDTSTGILHRRLATLTPHSRSGPLSATLALSASVHDFLLRRPVTASSLAHPAAANDHAPVHLADGQIRVVTPRVPLLDVIVDPEAVDTLRQLVSSHTVYGECAQQWHLADGSRGLRVLISGGAGLGKTRLCEALAHHCGRAVVTIDGIGLSTSRSDALNALQRALDEAFYRRGLVVWEDADVVLGGDGPAVQALVNALDESPEMVLFTSRRPQKLSAPLTRRLTYRCQLRRPTGAERRHIWDIHLPPEVPITSDVDLDTIADTYEFSGADIARAVTLAASRAAALKPKKRKITAAMLHRASRAQLTPVNEALTAQSRSQRRLADIVLPERVRVAVEDVLGACRNQSTVLTRWGFGEKLSTGTGITVLFDGPPGTGKTYCAEILAAELDRPLFRVNLAEVVSKWIGETEKNLQALFQQARIGRALLLFDEADALFAKRVSETKSSNDRNANLEVNLLLQEMERFPGICFLTTNHFEGFDKAVVRRIAYRVTFERPGPEQRARIWETLLPDGAPRSADVDFDALGEDFELTGGQIKNALLRAAYWAADRGTDVDGGGIEGGAITQNDLERACRREYVANGKVIREVAA